jgi:hypothetical protein
MARVRGKVFLILVAIVAGLLVFACHLSPITFGTVAHAKQEIFDENFYELKAETVLLSQYTTHYQSSSYERKHNIKLAASKINKTKIHPSNKFSFNTVVGSRSAKNGYMISKIIVNNQFKEGVGGGVCQVSTTLYNAVLLAGLKVEKVESHSLPISYVPLSFDAMVSAAQDFVFVNNTSYIIIVETQATDESITFKIFGEQPKRKQKIVLRSETIKEIDGGYEVVTDADGTLLGEWENEKITISAKKGYVSVGYIDVYEGGRLIKTTKIREDKYAARQGKKIVRAVPLPENPLNFETEFQNL